MIRKAAVILSFKHAIIAGPNGTTAVWYVTSPNTLVANLGCRLYEDVPRQTKLPARLNLSEERVQLVEQDLIFWSPVERRSDVDA